MKLAEEYLDDLSDHRTNEIRAMRADDRKEQREWMEAHGD